MKNLCIGTLKNILEKTDYKVKINLFNSGIMVDSEVLREMILKILEKEQKKKRKN